MSELKINTKILDKAGEETTLGEYLSKVTKEAWQEFTYKEEISDLHYDMARIKFKEIMLFKLMQVCLVLADNGLEIKDNNN